MILDKQEFHIAHLILFFETMSHLSVAYGLEYISKGEFEELNKEYEGLTIGINNYIAKIKDSNKN